MALDDPAKKMSKSDENLNGSITLVDDADTIRRKFKRAVTDSGTEIRFDESRPAITNLLTIYQLLTARSSEEIEAHFEGRGYAQLKSELADVTIEFLRPFQERMKSIGDEELHLILAAGADKARTIARETMREVKERMGIVGA
jgi:tryptophanyl-tRNA synthetase